VERFKALPDYLQIWPGHGAGSACGKALGAIPSTTLGYEKLFNPAFQFDAEEPFVRWLLDGQPEAPRYFAQMKKVNKEGPALLATLDEPQLLPQGDLARLLAEGAFVVDLRSAEAYTQAYVPGTVNIPATANNFSTYVGWFVDYAEPLYLILPDPAHAATWVRSLRAIGVDRIGGYWGPEVAHDDASLPLISSEELATRLRNNGIVVLDVRGRTEYTDQHIVGALNIPLGFLPQRLSQVPRDHLVVTQCAGGYRSQIAASLLRARGYDNVLNLPDGQERWSKALPTARGA
jgi:hydroxyacylglutathione hydrolase